MGIRQAFTQAYRAQANGRAERAGRQILDRLSKLNVQGEVNWVEALPKVLEQHHDAEGESGMSPYNIIFGRHRHRAGIPQQPPRDCEDAQAFLQRMEEIDKRVAETLNTKHDQKMGYVNRNRSEWASFSLGTKVWVYKHTRIGGWRLQGRWWGPAIVTRRVGDNSYVVQWGDNDTQLVHADDLKEFPEPILEGEGVDLEFRATGILEGQIPEEKIAEKILLHKLGQDGNLYYMVKWQNLGYEHSSWEVGSEFARKFTQVWLEYVTGKNIPISPSQEVTPHS
jgi:hypothetical protein